MNLSLPFVAGLAACCALSVPVVQAQTSAAPSTTLETVVVSATSRLQALADVQAAVQVIGSAELRAYAGTSLTEALMLATGVDARPNGANSTIAIRGVITNAGSPVLLLVDGLRRTAKYGGVNLNLIAVEDIERVEIIRGPMSALYGADATGGVVNVITKKPGSAEPGTGTVRAMLGQTSDGQRGTATVGGTLNFAAAGGAHRVSVEQREREAFRYNTEAVLADLGDISQAFASLSGQWSLGSAHQLGYVVEHLTQRDTSPGLLAAAPPARPVATVFDGYERERRNFVAIRYAGSLADGELAVDVSQGQSLGSTTRAFPTIETTDYTQRQLQTRYARQFGAHALVAGLGKTEDELAISIASQRATRSSTFVLLQDEWSLGSGLRLLAGWRRDRFSDFGSVNTPRLALSWATGPWSVRLGHGEAYRAPSVLEQYSSFLRGRFLIVGDPSLKPETNKTNELAVAWRQGSTALELTVFDADVRNLIQTVTRPRLPSDPSSVTSRSQYTNVAQAQLKGAELQGSVQWNSQWSTQLGVDLLDAEDATTGARLTQRARSIVRLAMRYASGPWRTELRLRRYGDYWNADPALRGSAPFSTNYSTADLRMDYQVNAGLSLSAGLDNLNSARQPINWSNTGANMDPPARFAYFSARYRF
jgi:outer membrane receptor for ferrienterochelin and colicin